MNDYHLIQDECDVSALKLKTDVFTCKRVNLEDQDANQFGYRNITVYHIIYTGIIYTVYAVYTYTVSGIVRNLRERTYIQVSWACRIVEQ